MARVESEKPEPEEEQNGANRGVAGPTHTRGIPGDDVRWLRSIVENGMEIVKIVALDGTLLYANAAFERILGHDPETTIGTMNVLDYVHPDDLEHVGKEAERALAEGGTVTSKAEYRFRHADGSWRWVESVGAYLSDDPAVKGLVVTVRDVTGRKEAEEALRRSEAEVFSVLESITDAFFSLDREWRFVYINPRAQLLLGRSREDLVGEMLWEDP